MKTPTAQQAIIPATPGFFVVEPITEDNKIVEAGLIPIIGWIIREGCVFPVTPIETLDNTFYNPNFNTPLILTPENLVLDGINAVYESLQEWMDDQNKEREAKHERNSTKN